MTHFERTYLMHRPSKLAISYADGSDNKSGVYDLTDAFNKHHQEIAMQLEYRELDRLAMELEKEIIRSEKATPDICAYRITLFVIHDRSKRCIYLLNFVLA